MPRKPKPSLIHESPPAAPDDVSPTGSRRTPPARTSKQRAKQDAPLETYEQTPERGSEDARLLAGETPRDTRRDDPI